MKNENKSFYSISLENEITITGNSPIEVYEFLHEMKSAFYHLSEYYNINQTPTLADDATKTFWQINNAIEIIINHLNQLNK